ncbi:MAG: ABC transporter permease [Aggregatilineales bacterium]
MSVKPTVMRVSWQRWLRRFGTLVGFLLVVAFFWWQKPATFMTLHNWLNITQQVSILGVVAFTMTTVMVLGDFDLSVGTMASLAGVTAALAFQRGDPVWSGIGEALIVGMLGGLLNGALVSYIGITPFVATLGTLTVFGGLALSVSSGKTIFGRAIPDSVSGFAQGSLALGTIGSQDITIPNLTLLAVVVLIVVWLVLEQTVFGRRLYAIGGNREAARLAGIRVRVLRLIAFVATGIGAALAGLMLVSRLASANPTQGDGLMLNAIAAVFLGMTMSEEGEPHVLGTLVGVLILGVLNNGLTQIQIDSYIQQILTGAIIILAVTLSSVSRWAH